MWVSRKEWDALQTKVASVNGQVRDVSRFLGIAFYSDNAKESEKPNELRIVAGLLKRAAELLEETTR